MYLICNFIIFIILCECKVEKWNSHREQEQIMERLVLHMRLGCGLLSITTSVSLPVNELDVLSVLHGQVSLAAVNHICAIHEAMNDCKTIRIH